MGVAAGARTTLEMVENALTRANMADSIKLNFIQEEGR
jgi:hypothetical protein